MVLQGVYPLNFGRTRRASVLKEVFMTTCCDVLHCRGSRRPRPQYFAEPTKEAVDCWDFWFVSTIEEDPFGLSWQ